MDVTLKMLDNRQFKAYLVLVALIICGLAAATVTASKVVHLGINFPFSNIVFSIFTYPIVDCICELWGKKVARQTVWLALGSQLLVVLLLQFSIVIPHASFWNNQKEYATILSVSGKVVTASFLAFFLSQILDIIVYQKIKNICRGKLLWLRSNVSTFIGQIIDSSIFVSIVFYASPHKFNILLGSIGVKIIISILMTPFVYLIVMWINRYLQFDTQAFKSESSILESKGKSDIASKQNELPGIIS